MIKIYLTGHENVHGYLIELPAVPSKNDIVVYGTKEYIVERVTWFVYGPSVALELSLKD